MLYIIIILNLIKSEKKFSFLCSVFWEMRIFLFGLAFALHRIIFRNKHFQKLEKQKKLYKTTK